jgi:hypothetical protein
MDKKYNCQYCLEVFDTDELLKKHHKNSKFCLKYKDVLFTCTKCNFKTKGIKNIEKHMEICVQETSIIPLNKESEIETYSDDEIVVTKKTVNDIIKKLNIIITNTTLSRTKNIFTNEKINLSPKKQQVKDLSSLQFYIKEDVEIKNESINLSEINSVKSSPSVPKSRKLSFKKLKNCIELVDEISIEEKNNNILSITSQIQDKQNSFNEIIKNSEKIIKEAFDSIKQNKTYQKHLEMIKKERLKLMKVLPFSSYYQMLQKHLKTLENIFKQKKEINEKKVINYIAKSMNSLDMRFVYYNNYTNISLDLDEIQNFKESLMFFNMFLPSCFEVFDSETFFKKFYNYGSVIFTIKDSIEMYISNYYNFNKIIYVPIKNSLENDPYSFYILEDIQIKNNEKRYWKMDCRLEEFSNSFISNIKPYLIQLFRKLYYDVFNDNEYRKDYKKTNTITEYDCEQLLQNIYILSYPKDLCLLIRNIVKDKCTYYPSENDRFNLHGDDIVQKKRLSIKDNIDIVEVIKLLFDNISAEDAVDFYRSS